MMTLLNKNRIKSVITIGKIMCFVVNRKFSGWVNE